MEVGFLEGGGKRKYHADPLELWIRQVDDFEEGVDDPSENILLRGPCDVLAVDIFETIGVLSKTVDLFVWS